MWFFSEALFDYLKARSVGKKIVDVFLIITLFTWICAAYVVATNYTTIKQAIFAKPIDVKSLVLLDRSINDVLTDVMNQVKADRALLARFHDSVKDTQGNHFVYESRTNEVVQPGVSMVALMRQNILLSTLNLWAQAFVRNDCVFVAEQQKTDAYYTYFSEIGVKSDIMCPVVNLQGALVGYLSMEFTTQSSSAVELKKKEPIVREAASKVGAILSVKVE